MAEEKVAMDYSLKYGGIDEVLAGDGRSVTNYEELYPSKNNSLIVVPRVVGVHQTIRLAGIEETVQLPRHIQSIIQRSIRAKFGSQDEVDGTLIALVYDPQVIPERVMKSMVLKQDVMRRLNLSDYQSVPDFSSKPIISDERVMKLAEDLEGKKTRKGALVLLEREVEYFLLNREHYGLTRIEALNHDSLTRTIEEIKELAKGTRSEETAKSASRLITNPMEIMLTRLFNDFMTEGGLGPL